MNTEKNYTLQIVMLSISLVVLSICIVTVVNIGILQKNTSKDIEIATENYISEQKRHARDQVRFIVNSIEFRKQRVKATLENLIKAKVDEAVAISTKIYEENKGKLSDKRIQGIIKNYLSSAQFSNENGYFFAVDMDTSKIIAHKVPKFIGYDMGKHRDAKGLNILQLQRDIFKKGGSGFHDMYFTKPTTNEEYPKRVYVKLFKPYNWLIGTGEYYDTIEALSQQTLIKRFSKISIDGNIYHFIAEIYKDKDGVKWAKALLNPNKPEMVGKTISLDKVDSQGNKFFKMFLETTSSGKGGFVEYWIKKPGTDKEVKKMSYVYYQKDWNWLIGSGFYFDDLEKHINAKKDELKKSTQNNIRYSILLAIILSISSYIAAVIIADKINSTIKQFTDEINSMNESLVEKIDIEVKKSSKQEQIIYEQKKLADMGQMINAIAHQWRQPLNALGLYGQEIVNQIDKKKLEEEFVRDFSKTHFDLVQHLSTTIDDFSNFFKPDKDKEIYNLLTQIKNLIDLVDIQFSNNNIDITISCLCFDEVHNIRDLGEDLKCEHQKVKLHGYPGELRQVLINILYNAKDAITEAREAGEIDKGLINLHLCFKDDNINIEISNNGGVIPEEIKPNIFLPYFTTKDESQGTGLGLYMSKISIETHMGGELTLGDSTDRTVFIISLPISISDSPNT